jgi:oligopeptide/dipeptide ABC transporter ATP-binding protein
MKKILEIKNLKVGFDIEEQFFEALHDITFHLEKGKSLGLVGESGCGKSLTASSIMKLLAPNAIIKSGEIFYNGENILNYSNKQMQKLRGSKIVLIPQDPMTSLNPLYTIGEQVVESIKYHTDLTKEEAKNLAIKTLKDVKIPEAEKRYNDYPHQFSGGMRQRVIIAMALSCNPELIIADEPTTALDVTVQAQILDLIKEIQKNYGTSLILITHDLAVIAETCDKVAVMYAGRIVEYADTVSLFEAPSHPYTQGLLSSLPDKKEEKLNTIEGQPPSIYELTCGCPFYPRCTKRMDICLTAFPKTSQISENHTVNCYLYN